VEDSIMRIQFAAAFIAALGAATAIAQESPGASAERIQLANLAVREMVVFVNAAPWPVTFGVSTGRGPWQPITLQPGARQKYFCTGCPGFKAGIASPTPQGKVVREEPLEPGYVYEIYYNDRGPTKHYAFRRAGPA
jgi:hypothetical protein